MTKIKTLLKSTALAGTALVLGLISTAPAHAFQVFSNRTAWQSTYGSGSLPFIYTETFDTQKADATSITFDDYPIVSTGVDGTTKFNGVGNDGRYSGGIKRGNPRGVGGDYFDAIVWTFPETVKGFFFDYISFEKVVLEGDFNGNGVIEATESIRIKNLVNPSDAKKTFGSTGSFGLAGTGRFNQITFKIDPTENNASENFKIDNLSVAVPTPALLPGLIALGASLWRKRKGEQAAEAKAEV